MAAGGGAAEDDAIRVGAVVGGVGLQPRDRALRIADHARDVRLGIEPVRDIHHDVPLGDQVAEEGSVPQSLSNTVQQLPCR